MSVRNMMMIDASFLGSSWDAALPFKDAVLAVMRASRRGDCFMDHHDDDEKFQLAVAIVVTKATGEDRAWVDAQVDALKKLNAVFVASRAGLSVDIASFLDGVDDAIKQRDYSLRELWEKAKT